MALWHDPLDELIADLERTLPVQPTPSIPDFPPRDFVGMMRMLQEIMKSSPRVPLGPDPSDDRDAPEHHDGSKPTQ